MQWLCASERIYFTCQNVNASYCLLTLCVLRVCVRLPVLVAYRLLLKHSHYGKDYRVSSMVAPWQLNRVWAELHCLVSTRVTHWEWIVPHTHTHAFMQASLRCGVRAGLCTQSLISDDDRLHTHMGSEAHTNSSTMQQALPGERVHTSRSVFCSRGGLRHCPTPATHCM